MNYLTLPPNHYVYAITDIFCFEVVKRKKCTHVFAEIIEFVLHEEMFSGNRKPNVRVQRPIICCRKLQHLPEIAQRRGYKRACYGILILVPPVHHGALSPFIRLG